MLGSKCLILFVLIYFGKIRGQWLSNGDKCTLEATRVQGICKAYSDCPKAIENFRKGIYPQLCGFRGQESLVCCITKRKVQSREPGEISKTKCREYSKYVMEKKRPPILLIDVPEIEKNECGHKVVKLIIGGDPAGRKEFPHMAVIGYEPSPGNIKWACGGSLISNEYILTAAHCLSSKDLGRAKYVKIGVTNLTDTGMYRQEFNVAERIPFPRYRSFSHYHDIALIKLDRTAKMNPHARPACLCVNKKIEAKKAIATGWGHTTWGGEGSEELRKVTLDLFDNNYCNRSYRNQISKRLRNGIKDNLQLCAGSEDEQKDTCQGDSGGPLQIYHVSDNITCMYDIVGVTSFGKACGGNAGVYSRVANYVKWIEDVVWPQAL